MRTKTYMKKTMLLIVLLAGVLTAMAEAAPYIGFRHKLLNTDNGLPTNYITTLVQDNQGYIWMATTNGLTRYDGYGVQTYRHEDSGCELLQHNRIRNLYMNPNGLLLIRLQHDRYSCFDTNQQRFLDFTGGQYDMQASYRDCQFMKNGDTWLWSKRTGALRIRYQTGGGISARLLSEKGGELACDNVTFISDDADGTVWIGTVKGLYAMRGDQLTCANGSEAFNFTITMPQGQYFTTADGVLYRAGKDGKLQQVTRLKEQMKERVGIWGLARKGDRLMVVTDRVTYELDLATRQLSVCPDIQAPKAEVKTDNRGNNYLTDVSGVMWYIDQQTGRVLSVKAYEAEHLTQVTSATCGVLTTADGYLIVSTVGNGVFVHDLQTGRQVHWTVNSQPYTPLPSNTVYGQLEDRSGKIWMSLENYGLTCIQLQPRWAHISYPSQQVRPTRYNSIRMMRQLPDGTIWAGNKAQQLFLVGRDGALKEYPTGLDIDVLSVARDRDGQLWLGTRNGVKIGDKLYRNDRNDTTSLLHNKVTDILCDSKGRMWLSTYGGICLAQRQSDGSYRFRQVLRGTPYPRLVNMLTQLADGEILAGCGDGLLAFRPDEVLHAPGRYHFYREDNSPLGNFEIRDIIEDSGHNVWVASAGGGLFQLQNRDYAHLQFKHYTTREGLSDNTVNALQSDRRGILWIATDYGLSRMNTEKQLIGHTYPMPDRVGNVFGENAAVMDADGGLYFGTNNGVLTFHPQQLPVVMHSDTVCVTSLRINGAPFADYADEIDIDRHRITLNHDENSLTFYFSDLGFEYPQSTEYQYWLEGYDKGWSPASADNFAIYKNLSPGDYVFHVRRLADLDSDREGEAIVRVHIRQPWYNTWWAWLIYLLIIGAIAYYIFLMLRSNYVLENRVKLEREQADFRSRFFMDVSHEFRTPLSLIQGSMDKLNSLGEPPGNMKQPLGNMNRSVARMMRLINQLLEFNKAEKGALQLRLQETNVVAFVRDIQRGFRDVADNKHINANFTSFAQQYKMYVDCNMLDKIVYNLLSNAFKYTPEKGSVTIRLQLTDDERLRIIVEDTGVGVPKEMQQHLFERFQTSNYRNDGMGIGLHLTARLVETHHGRIWYEENQPQGSIFYVELPTSIDVYQKEDFMAEDFVQEGMQPKSADWLLDYKELAGRPLNDRTVLLVEDDTDLQMYLKSELMQYFAVQTADNGAKALDLIKERKPDLIVSDIKMPEMSGIELLKRVRADEELFDIPFVLLTATDSPKRQLQGAQYGADAYLPKPFSRELLITRCLSLIEQRDKLRAAYSHVEEESGKGQVLMASEQDRRFLEQFDILIDRELGNPEMNVDDIAATMKYSRSKFYRKVKEITGMTPNDYIKPKRMKRAAAMLRDDQTITVAEVAYKVGFSDPIYFGRCFKQYFGITPSKYQRGLKPEEAAQALTAGQ